MPARKFWPKHGREIKNTERRRNGERKENGVRELFAKDDEEAEGKTQKGLLWQAY